MDKGVNVGRIPKRDFLEMVSRMYYVLEMTQKEIADQLGVGRSSVARFLSEAKDEGVVRFIITSKTETSRSIELEAELIKKYELTDVIVVKDTDFDYASFEVTVANYLNSLLPFHGAVGIGGGKTMKSISSIMNICEPRPNLNVVQTIGGFSSNEEEMPSISTVQTWAQSLEANPQFLMAPAIVEDKETKEFYLKNKSISDVYEALANLDVLVLGIGSMKDTDIIKKVGVENIDINVIHKKCVGDINLHFFNEKGIFSIPELSDRVIGLSPANFKNAATRVGIAYGNEKIEPIKAALTGKLINILVTTTSTAKCLLESNLEK